MKTLKELQDSDAQRQKELVAMKQVRIFIWEKILIHCFGPGKE
jgi:hypothetical protein